MKGVRKSLKERIAYLRLLAGDTDAFGFFYDQYAAKIYTYVLFRTSDKEIAQDITHDVFLRAWQYIIDKKTIRNFRALLYQIARNKIVDFYRAKEQTPTLLDETVATVVPAQSGSGYDLDILRQRIALLKDEYQEVITLRHLEGLSIEEISTVLGKDKNNVRVTLHRALTKLKDLYQEIPHDPSNQQN
ncbi:MAG: RNA polymerase sigma factor [Candidatus Komeilibacteria bacterium]